MPYEKSEEVPLLPQMVYTPSSPKKSTESLFKESLPEDSPPTYPETESHPSSCFAGETAGMAEEMVGGASELLAGVSGQVSKVRQTESSSSTSAGQKKTKSCKERLVGVDSIREIEAN